MSEPKVSIYALHEIACLPPRYHGPFLELIVRLRGMEEEQLNRTLMALSSKAIPRVLSADDVKRLGDLVTEGRLAWDSLEQFARDSAAHIWELESELPRYGGPPAG